MIFGTDKRDTDEIISKQRKAINDIKIGQRFLDWTKMLQSYRKIPEFCKT